MPIERDKKRGTFVFVFDRRIGGQRIRARKRLPRAWNQSQADAFDRKESARLYAAASGAGAQTCLIDDAIELYLRHRLPTLKHGRNVAHEIAQTAWAWNGRPLSALPDVAKAIQLKAGDLAPATVKNRIAYLRAACRFAWKHFGLGDADPAARVTVPTVRNERHVYLTRAEMLTLCRACPHLPTRAMIRIAFYSGMRYSEIMGAEIVGGRFVLRDSKNGDPRIVPMHPRIRSAVNVEKTSRYTLDYWFKRAREAIGRPDLHFHDLRHSAASALINEGVDIYTVGAVLGHRSAASTKRYAHHMVATLDAAVAKIGRRA